jgi:aspartyl/asparaginyl-tRNA synthetase
MIRRILAADLRGHIGETVSVAGWVQALRLQRAMQFAVLRDHTGTAQVTHRRDDSPLDKALDALTTESAVRITGRVVANPVVSLGGLEIILEEITVCGPAEAPLPVDGQSGPEHRLDWRFLDVRRRPGAREVFAVQTTVENAMREFACANGCTEMHTPKLMGTASESGAARPGRRCAATGSDRDGAAGSVAINRTCGRR